MIEPVLITSDSLSMAWATAFEHVLQPGASPPLLVQIAAPEGRIIECEGIRSRLDDSLLGRGLSSTATVANTIFPNSLWNPNGPRQELYERYEAIWPKVKRCPPNYNGVYFQRLIAFPEYGHPDETNQLEYIISTYEGRGNHRHSAHQASIFFPPKDDTHQRQRGFPCLQQVSFCISPTDLTIMAFYPKQLIYRKAYGNYLGLCRLGAFMACELGKAFAGIRCFIDSPDLHQKPGKTALRALRDEIKVIADGDIAGNA